MSTLTAATLSYFGFVSLLASYVVIFQFMVIMKLHVTVDFLFDIRLFDRKVIWLESFVTKWCRGQKAQAYNQKLKRLS